MYNIPSATAVEQGPELIAELANKVLDELKKLGILQ